MKLSLIEALTLVIAIVLIMISLIIGVAIKPGIEIAAIAITPTITALIVITPIIEQGLRVSVSPIIATPIAYTVYYMITEYIKLNLNPLTITYSILLGSTITMTIAATYIVVRKQVITSK
ncbi:MAG: hypothetical protein QXJ70_07430 [Acidilobaceae archaeon]